MLDDYNEIYYGYNKLIPLTTQETYILAFLIDNKNRLVTIKELCKEIYGEYTKKHDITIRVFIHAINKKLKGEIWIRTIRNVGYKIEYLGD